MAIAGTMVGGVLWDEAELFEKMVKCLLCSLMRECGCVAV